RHAGLAAADRGAGGTQRRTLAVATGVGREADHAAVYGAAESICRDRNRQGVREGSAEGSGLRAGAAGQGQRKALALISTDVARTAAGTIGAALIGCRNASAERGAGAEGRTAGQDRQGVCGAAIVAKRGQAGCVGENVARGRRAR